jgi:hypothetical protein
MGLLRNITLTNWFILREPQMSEVLSKGRTIKKLAQKLEDKFD